MESYKLRIRDLREDADLNQSQIAKIMNCTQTCLSKYELGQRDIPTKILIAFAKYFDVSLDYLCGVTNERRPFPKA